MPYKWEWENSKIEELTLNSQDKMESQENRIEILKNHSENNKMEIGIIKQRMEQAEIVQEQPSINSEEIAKLARK